MCMGEQNGIFHLALLEDGACAVLQYSTVSMVYGIWYMRVRDIELVS